MAEQAVDGGGLRYNAGKAPFDMLPLRLMLDCFYTRPEDRNHAAYLTLSEMARWQEGDPNSLDIAIRCLTAHSGDSGFRGLAAGAQVFQDVTTRPVKPYPKWNWMRGMAWSIPLGCIIRHCLAWLDGQDLDPDTGLPHYGHIQCNLIMLKFYQEHFPQGDDRPVEFFKKPIQIA